MSRMKLIPLIYLFVLENEKLGDKQIVLVRYENFNELPSVNF